jgi:hypothetical protein
LGFKVTYSDSSLYVFRNKDQFVLLPFHVDDGTFAATSDALADKLISNLSQHFKLRDLGPTDFLLGIRIKQDLAAGRVELSQRQYVIDMLTRFNMADCKPVTTPMTPGLRLSYKQAPQSEEEKQHMDSIPYANAVGTLLYLATSTHPDIAYTVSVLCRFIANPGMAHWRAVHHLFRYLQGTKDAKLVYRRDAFDAQQIFATFCDADHAGNPDNMRSTGGYALLIAGGAVSWSSRLMPILALSTTEAEYISAVEAAKEMIWMRQLLSEFGYTLKQPSPLQIDNQSAISVAKNPEHHGRMKHLDLRYYWLRDQVEDGKVVPDFVPTKQQSADIFTKSLPRVDLERCRDQLGLQF